MTLLPEPVAPGDEQVRHLGEVDGLGRAGHVPPEGERQLRARGREVDLLEDPAQGDDVEVLVRDLDADRALARDRRLDPERAGGEGHREVVGEGLDPADLDVGGRLDLVLGHDGAGVAADDLGRDVEARELLDDDLLVPLRGATSLPAGLDRQLAMSSSSVDRRRGRTRSRSFVGGESPASVTSSGSRSGRSPTSSAPTGVWTAAPPARAGANVADVGIGLGTASRDVRASPGGSSPQMPVWPGGGATAAHDRARPSPHDRPRPSAGAPLPGPTGVPGPAAAGRVRRR